MLGGLGKNSAQNARKIIPNLWLWGQNSTLGAGDTTSRVSPVRVDTKSNWASASLGRSTTVARKTDRTIWSWGLNTTGELGQGIATTTIISSPVQIGTDTNWSVISVGGSTSASANFRAHVMAIKTDGTLWGWGNNANNTSAVATSTAAGRGRIGDGTVVSKSSPVQIGTDTNWATVSAGALSTTAVRTDGTLWTWGDNYYVNNTTTLTGVLGSNSASTSSPVQVGTDTNWSKVFTGSTSAYAIKTDGTLWSWGTNSNGQLGLGDTTARSSPVQVGTDTNWSTITTTRTLASTTSFIASVLAIKTNGTLWAWGSNGSGQLGLGDITARSSPVQVGTDTNWYSVTCISTATLATKTDGTRWAWGANTSGYQWGAAYNTTQESTPVQLITTLWSSIATKGSQVLGITTANTLFGWGNNTVGVLGLGDTTVRSSPVQVGTDTNWSAVTCGDSHTIAVKSTGTIWTWGDGSFSKLGVGDATSRSSPIQIGTGTDWGSKISGGLHHTHAIKPNGTLWGWGYNFFGTLGLGDAGSAATRSSPVQVGTDTTWSVIANGNYQSIGIKTDGTMYGWGLNDNGQLGLGDATNRSSPVQIGTDTNWSTVSCGSSSFTMAVRSTGTLWAWGSNVGGRLGLGDIISRSSPVQVGTDTTWSSVFCGGGTHSLAIKTNGTLWAWGTNTNGQLGIGDTTDRSSPVQVGTDTDWSFIRIGGSHTLGVKTNNTLWFWGSKTNGTPGDGLPYVSSSSPIQIGTFTNWESFTGANLMVIGLKKKQTALGYS